jgi:cytochrome b561
MAAASRTGYTFPQKTLHWLMALAIFFNLLFADGMEHWNRLVRRGEPVTAADISSANIHAYVGIAILLLCLVRLILRLVQGVPEAPANEPNWQNWQPKLGIGRSTRFSPSCRLLGSANTTSATKWLAICMAARSNYSCGR